MNSRPRRHSVLIGEDTFVVTDALMYLIDGSCGSCGSVSAVGT